MQVSLSMSQFLSITPEQLSAYKADGIDIVIAPDGGAGAAAPVRHRRFEISRSEQTRDGVPSGTLIVKVYDPETQMRLATWNVSPRGAAVIAAHPEELAGEIRAFGTDALRSADADAKAYRKAGQANRPAKTPTAKDYFAALEGLE